MRPPATRSEQAAKLWEELESRRAAELAAAAAAGADAVGPTRRRFKFRAELAIFVINCAKSAIFVITCLLQAVRWVRTVGVSSFLLPDPAESLPAIIHGAPE